MINKYKIQTYRLLESLTQIERNQSARLAELDSYADVQLKIWKSPSKREYYHVRQKTDSEGNRTYNKTKYLGNGTNDTVKKVKEAKYLKASISVLKNNIGLLQSVVDGICEIDRETINKLLPATYQSPITESSEQGSQKAIRWRQQALAYKERFNIFRPEDLKHKTDDGTMVRSKSEAIIYNLLLRLGVTFVYELPLRTSIKTFYPDFTILCETDYTSVVLIEHQGMMDDSGYREHFKNRVYDYLKAGYVQGINIFFTFDRLDGGIDTDPIMDLIRLKVRPPEAMQIRN